MESKEPQQYHFVNNRAINYLDAYGLRSVGLINNKMECECKERGGKLGNRAQLLGYNSVEQCADLLYQEMVSDHPLLGSLYVVATGVDVQRTIGGKVPNVGNVKGGRASIPIGAILGALGAVGSWLTFDTFCQQAECTLPDVLRAPSKK
jgi:hypothetical protein